jgi:hypothetical protein
MTPWATTVISLLVLVVAFMQWRTAHQKTVMDLFDRRMKVLLDFTEALDLYLSSDGNLSGTNVRRRLEKIQSDSQFLFGAEISLFIGEVSAKTLDRDAIRNKMNRETTIDAKSELSYHLYPLEHYCHVAKIELARLMRPYVLMDHKRVRTFSEWFHDADERRRSYGDA